jgi:hypothetical protein
VGRCGRRGRRAGEGRDGCLDGSVVALWGAGVPMVEEAVLSSGCHIQLRAALPRSLQAWAWLQAGSGPDGLGPYTGWRPRTVVMRRIVPGCLGEGWDY